MKVLMIDNYDSFTFNLVHYLEADENVNVTVWKNDAIDFNRLEEFDKIVISPGPGLPQESGDIIELIQSQAKKKAILGICMGHQAMAQAFGGELKNLEQVYHGVSTPATLIKNDPIFQDMDAELEIGRYHSWVVDRNTFPSQFDVLAEDDQGEIMAMRHKEFNLIGLQFHPESILTKNGFQMIQNWLNLDT